MCMIYALYADVVKTKYQVLQGLLFILNRCHTKIEEKLVKLGAAIIKMM